MDASLECVTATLPPDTAEMQGPCIDPNRIDALNLDELKRLHDEDEAQKKVRAYWFVFWPESVNASKLFDIMRNSGFGIVISPLHDKDIKDQDTGELAKPHYHVIVRFPQPRYLEPTRRLIGSWLYDADALTGSDEYEDASWYVRPVPDFAGALRYLCHIDDKDKHRYPENEVMVFGFVDISMLYANSLSDDVESYYKLLAWCRQNPTRTYADLMDAVYDSEDRGLMRTLQRYSYTLKAYISDRTGRKPKKQTA